MKELRPMVKVIRFKFNGLEGLGLLIFVRQNTPASDQNVAMGTLR